MTIEYGGQQKTIMTSKPTVGDALIEEGYSLDDIEAHPGLDTKIHENLHISVEKSAARKAEEAARQREEQAEAVNTSRGAQRYSSVLTMEATAYLPTDGDGSGITATGLMAGYGIAAVDPSVIPLGTRLYIPGYGEAVAADTGGAIYGDRIDLCMESYGEAMAFGRRGCGIKAQRRAMTSVLSHVSGRSANKARISAAVLNRWSGVRRRRFVSARTFLSEMHKSASCASYISSVPKCTSLVATSGKSCL